MYVARKHSEDLSPATRNTKPTPARRREFMPPQRDPDVSCNACSAHARGRTVLLRLDFQAFRPSVGSGLPYIALFERLLNNFMDLFSMGLRDVSRPLFP